MTSGYLSKGGGLDEKAKLAQSAGLVMMHANCVLRGATSQGWDSEEEPV